MEDFESMLVNMTTKDTVNVCDVRWKEDRDFSNRCTNEKVTPETTLCLWRWRVRGLVRGEDPLKMHRGR